MRLTRSLIDLNAFVCPGAASYARLSENTDAQNLYISDFTVTNHRPASVHFILADNFSSDSTRQLPDQRRVRPLSCVV